VTFTPIDEPELNDQIDEAYSKKYSGSPFLPPMVSAGTRAATVRVDPAPLQN